MFVFIVIPRAIQYLYLREIKILLRSALIYKGVTSRVYQKHVKHQPVYIAKINIVSKCQFL